MPNYPVHRTTLVERQQLQRLDRDALERYQLGRLNQMLATILPENKFYREKLVGVELPLQSLDAVALLPLTCKQELLGAGGSASFATNLTWPVAAYTRLHRTSGTQGHPLSVLDTADDWQWWLETWQPVLDVADVQARDRVVLAFSFGPFIGFWSAFEAAVERGCLVAPAGAMKSLARLELIRDLQATVVFCTPSYALHLAEVAAEYRLDLRQFAVRAIIVAGEPGGSIPATRDRIEQVWNANVIDHAGASEVGPWGFADPSGTGVYVNEAEIMPEFISLQNGNRANAGELAELVLTTLGRCGSPVIRYRTGDIVKPVVGSRDGCQFTLLAGGVLGRVDDMMIIRGVNVFPSSIEQILRGIPEIAEYRLTVFRQAALDQLKIEIEDRSANPQRVQEEIQKRIGLRVDVVCVPPGSLPRFEGKGRRLVDQREG